MKFVLYLKRKRTCGKELHRYCPSRISESKWGSHHDRWAARSKGTGRHSPQHPTLLLLCVKNVWMYGARVIWISSSSCLLFSGWDRENETEWLRWEVLDPSDIFGCLLFGVLYGKYSARVHIYIQLPQFNYDPNLQECRRNIALLGLTFHT